MYVPESFKEERDDVIHRLMSEYPLGTLVWNGPNGLDANHLPFELAPDTGEHGYLLAHVARANSIWQEVTNGDEVMVVFRGAESYISPNWYPSKMDSHRQVPTWNYQTVHVYGHITVSDDKKFLRGLVARLTRVHETRVNEEPWRMGDAPAEFITSMLDNIIGIKIAISRFVGKSKLSQNHELRDRINVAYELRNRGNCAMATAILSSADMSE